jgi:hypothetical protein
MTLEDKIYKTLINNPDTYPVQQIEKITEDFAIGFAEWIRKETYYEHLTKEFIYKRNVYESEKELLQIYKAEKGL